MAIPAAVVEDVQDMVGEGLVVLDRMRPRRIAAVLRSAGYEATPTWMDANEEEVATGLHDGAFDPAE